MNPAKMKKYDARKAALELAIRELSHAALANAVEESNNSKPSEYYNGEACACLVGAGIWKWVAVEGGKYGSQRLEWTYRSRNLLSAVARAEICRRSKALEVGNVASGAESGVNTGRSRARDCESLRKES